MKDNLLPILVNVEGRNPIIGKDKPLQKKKEFKKQISALDEGRELIEIHYYPFPTTLIIHSQQGGQPVAFSQFYVKYVNNQLKYLVLKRNMKRE